MYLFLEDQQRSLLTLHHLSDPLNRCTPASYIPRQQKVKQKDSTAISGDVRYYIPVSAIPVSWL